MKIFCLIIALALSTVTYSQNYIYRGEKQFIATQSWGFKLTNYSWTSQELDVTVAKTKTGGYLMLSIEVPFDEESISGSVFMILSNGKTVTLSTRVVSDHVDSKSQVLYSITLTQYQQLKESNISKVRFSIKNNKGVIGGVAGSYTATNKINEYSFGDEPKNWETAKEIKELDDREE